MSTNVGSVQISLKLDRNPFDKAIADLRSLKLPDLSVKLSVDASGIKTAQDLVKQLQNDLQKAAAAGSSFKVGLDSKPFESAFAKIREERERFAREQTQARVGIDDRFFRDGLGKLKDEKAQFARNPFTIPVGADTSKVKPAIDSGLSALKGGGAFSNIATGIGQGIGQSIAQGIGQAIGQAKQAFSTFLSFDAALNQFDQKVGVTAQELEAFRRQFLELGIATSKSPTEVAQAAKAYAQLGKTAEETKRDLEPVVRFLEAGNIKDPEAGAKIVSTAAKQFGVSIQEASDVIVKASDLGGADAIDFLQVLSKAGPEAKNAGQSLNTVASLFTVLRKSGGGAEELSTATRNIFSRLTPSSKEGEQALKAFEKQFDVTFRDPDTKRFGDFATDVLPKLKKGIDQLDPEEGDKFIKQIFGDEASAAIRFALSNLEEIQAGVTTTQEAAKRGGAATAEAAKKLVSGLSGAVSNLGSSIETVAINSISAIEPVLSLIVGGITEALSAIGKNFDFFNDLKAQVSGFVGFIQTTLEPVRTAIASAFESADFSRLTDSLTNISSIISSVFGGAATNAAQTFALNFADGLNTVIDIATRVSEVLEPIIFSSLQAIGPVFELVSQIGSSIGEAFSAIAPIIDVIAQNFQSVVVTISQIVGVVSGILTDALRNNEDAVTGIFEAFSQITAVVGGVLVNLFGSIKSSAEQNRDAFQAVVGAILQVAKTAAQILANAVRIAGVVANVAIAVGQKIAPAFGRVVGVVANVVSFLSKALSLATEIASRIIGILDKIPNVGQGLQDIASKIPGFGGKGKGKTDSSKDTNKAGDSVGESVQAAGNAAGTLKPEDSSKEIKKAGDKNVDAIEESTGKIRDAYAEQLSALQTRLNIGEISQEDFIKGKAGLDKSLENDLKTAQKTAEKPTQKASSGGATSPGVKLQNPKEEEKAEREAKKREREQLKQEKDTQNAALNQFDNKSGQQDQAIADAQAKKLEEVKQLQLKGQISAEAAAKREAAIAIDGTKQELAAKRSQLAEVQRLRASGAIDAQKAADKELQLQKDITKLGTQLLDQQLKEKQRKEEEALKAVEKANKEANERIIESQRNRTIAVKELQAKGAIDAEEAAKRLAKIESESINAELEAKKKQISEVKKLRSEGTISNEKGLQLEKQLQKELAELTLKRLDDEIRKQEQLRKEAMQAIDDRVAAEKRRSDQAIANLDQEIARLKTFGQQVLDIQQRLGSSRNDLAKALGNFDASGLENAQSRAEQAQKLVEQRDAENATPEQKQAAQNQLSQLGFNPNASGTAIADEQINLQRELLAAKREQLLLDQKVARENLEFDLKRQELAARINELEAKRNVLLQEQNLLKAQGNLQKAQELAPGKERERAVAAASQEVDLAKQGVQLAKESLQVTQLGNAQSAEIADNARRTLTANQAAEFNRFNNQSVIDQQNQIQSRNAIATREKQALRSDIVQPTYSPALPLNLNPLGLSDEQNPFKQSGAYFNPDAGRSGTQPFNGIAPTGGFLGQQQGQQQGQGQPGQPMKQPVSMAGLLEEITNTLKQTLLSLMSLDGTLTNFGTLESLGESIAASLAASVTTALESAKITAQTPNLPQASVPTSAPATVAPSKMVDNGKVIDKLDQLKSSLDKSASAPRSLTVQSENPVQDASQIWANVARQQAKYRRNRPDESFGLG